MVCSSGQRDRLLLRQSEFRYILPNSLIFIVEKLLVRNKIKGKEAENDTTFEECLKLSYGFSLITSLNPSR